MATAGLSILGKGLWDRITSGKKVCKKAQKEAYLLATKHGATPELDTPTDAGQGDSP